MDTISSATAFSGIRCGSWISSILWGKTHAEVFCDVHLASLLAEGNLPNLSKKSATGHLIICDKTAKNIIQNSGIFFRLKKIVHVEFLTLPSSVCKELRDPNLKDLFYVIYGLIDHLGIHFAKKQSANLFLLPIDSVLSENCLVRFYQAFGKGYEVWWWQYCGSPG